ncbi:hypothetical protein IFM89_025061 [Coptis chinensis]|uniref:Uncharacterized protein n=1 Tax=Coptis chinensis TaxID=261450 RepID=A0A835I1F9_9MAGN|nr:hypothetical protein IFM89_025061 [Coptis chinensis]
MVWLKGRIVQSHTNCPSCRAPIVSSPVLPASTAVVGNSGVREEAQVENSASDGGVGSELNREGGVSDLSLGVQGERVEVERSRGIDVQKKDLPAPFKMSKFRVFSDLSDNHRVGENEIQPVRRSASMDFNPASILCFSVANSLPVEEEDEGSSIAPVERGKKLNSSPSLFRLIGSSSKGKLLPKSPVSMKRSFSSGNKLISSRHSQNRSSFIPL